MKTKFLMGAFFCSLVCLAAIVAAAFDPVIPMEQQLGIKCGNAAAAGQFAIADCTNYCDVQGRVRGWVLGQVSACINWATFAFNNGPGVSPGGVPPQASQPGSFVFITPAQTEVSNAASQLRVEESQHFQQIPILAE